MEVYKQCFLRELVKGNSGTRLEPIGQRATIRHIIDGLGTRCGRPAYDHWTNSPNSGQHTATIRL